MKPLQSLAVALKGALKRDLARIKAPIFYVEPLWTAKSNLQILCSLSGSKLPDPSKALGLQTTRRDLEP